MISVKQSNLIGKRGNPEEYNKKLDRDVENLFLALQTGLVVKDTVTVADTGSANTEFIVPHRLGVVPTGWSVVSQDKATSVYLSGTAPTATNLYLKASTANVALILDVLK